MYEKKTDNNKNNERILREDKRRANLKRKKYQKLIPMWMKINLGESKAKHIISHGEINITVINQLQIKKIYFLQKLFKENYQ